MSVWLHLLDTKGSAADDQALISCRPVTHATLGVFSRHCLHPKLCCSHLASLPSQVQLRLQVPRLALERAQLPTQLCLRAAAPGT